MNFEIVCEHCRSRYQVPVELRERLRGQLVTCAVCTREWTPVTADPRAWTAAPAAGGPPLALHPFLQSNPYGTAPTAPGASPLDLGGARTQELRTVGAVPRPSLRVVASGPGLHLDAVFELGTLGFLIGGHGTHLELPHAHTLPDRAIRVRAVEGGFEFEGVGGFLIPLGPVSVAAGRIDAGARLDLAIDPYRITLEASAQKGGPIRDLDDRPAPPPPPPPSAPAPAAAPAPAPVSPSGGDMSQTVRGLAALGFDARRLSNPLDDLDVGFLGMDPPVQGETFWFKKSPTLVGRTAGDIVIADTRVSGKHAQIDVLGPDQYALKDLASTNGTTVNERPASITRLKDGDVVAFGGVRLQFLARPKKKKA
jgi:hypothetical protein